MSQLACNFALRTTKRVQSLIYFSLPRTVPARCFASAAKKEATTEAVNNTPVNFFGSKAASWKAKESRSGKIDTVVWYQPLVISLSLAAFLLYFCVLREENDIDLKLEGSLFDKVEGLEQVQMIVSYRYNRDNGLDVAELEKRLTTMGIDVKTL